MKKLLNPRGYLSHTQIDMWIHSRERYIRQYVHGEAQLNNSRMDFGSKVASAEETREKTDDHMIDMLVTLLPKYPIREHTIRVTFKTQHGEVDLLGKLDKFNDKTFAFRDTKTGTTKWTQNMANKHPQLDHYAALIYLKHGVIPPLVHLDWAQTEIYQGVPVLTGSIKTFKVKKTLTDVLKYLAVASRVAKEIDEMYRAEIKNLA